MTTPTLAAALTAPHLTLMFTACCALMQVVLLARVLHAHGLLSPGATWARIAGMLTTLAVIILAALGGLWMVLAR